LKKIEFLEDIQQQNYLNMGKIKSIKYIPETDSAIAKSEIGE